MRRPHWCRRPTAAFILPRCRAAPTPSPAHPPRQWSRATQADGVIDEDEQRRLGGAPRTARHESADRRALVEQLTTPVDPREIVNAATSPEVGLQIYAASVLAMAIDTPAERSYLDRLATALSIEPGFKAQVEQTLGRA